MSRTDEQENNKVKLSEVPEEEPRIIHGEPCAELHCEAWMNEHEYGSKHCSWVLVLSYGEQEVLTIAEAQKRNAY